MDLLRNRELASWPDPNTDPRLLPGFMRNDGNDQRMRCYRAALKLGMESLLTQQQREVLYMRFWLEMSLKRIGRTLGLSPSGVSKRVEIALDILRRYVGFCVEVDTAIQQEEG